MICKRSILATLRLLTRSRFVVLLGTGFLLAVLTHSINAQQQPPDSTRTDAPSEKAEPAGERVESAAENAPEEEESEAELPRFEDAALPEADDLLGDERRDWVVLQDGRLLVVEPVYPRPDTLAKIQAERNEILEDPGRRFSPAGRQQLAELTRLAVFLPGDGASTEYQIAISDVSEILHHEDLMLRRADSLIESGDTRKAFELIFVVSRRDPDWPGLSERQVLLTTADAARFLEEGDGERAIALIEALYERERVPDPADDLLDRAATLLIGGAIERADYRRARYELARVRQVDARHGAIARWTNRLIEAAKSHRSEAERAAAAGDDALAAVQIEKAARAWPNLQGLRPVHARLTSRYQQLRVGVARLASQEPLVLPSAADDRIVRLQTADLFEIDAFEFIPAYRSDYFERWEPTDLGRRARFALRSNLPGWAARPALTAPDVVRLLGNRLRRDHPAFDARFSDLVESLRLLGPYEFEVRFRRIPLRAETALTRSRFTAGNPATAYDEQFQRFIESERAADRVTYRRAVAESGGGERHLAEVVEIAYPSYEKAVQALDRGEVRMLADVPAWDVPRLREDDRYVITRLAVPMTHLLQFHPESEPLKSAELRRAIAVAADREDLFRIIAGQGTESAGRLVTAPYPSTHRGYDPLVEPRQADLPLALALTLAAQKRFGGALPELVFAAPAEAPARQAAEALATVWNRIGLPVRLVTLDELGPSGHWDIAYRHLAIPDPINALAPLITGDAGVGMDSLSDLPEWLRQRLLDLERAGDATTAQAVLIDLHHLLHADVRCVPLFEVDRYLVTRGTIRGLPSRPVAVYQSAERWVVPAEYPEATP